jgi:CheY-like chemotaxis protein
LLEEDIQIDFRPGAAEVVVRVDRAKLESVLLNLLLNAREAMGQGGRIQVATELRTTDDGLRYVIGVRDEGHGILAEHQDVIFDPFFTTRSEGEGSGLGLASALGIARRLGGDLRLVETSRFGSLFELALPLASDVQAEAGGPSAGSREGLHEATGLASLDGARVVVVEDNEAIGRLVQAELERHGAQVLVACDGGKGLELLTTGEAPDMVVCDVIMPGMGGPELYRRLVELDRQVPFLFTSGYPDRWSLEEFEDLGRVAFLPKPFDLETLRRRALELLT